MQRKKSGFLTHSASWCRIQKGRKANNSSFPEGRQTSNSEMCHPHRNMFLRTLCLCEGMSSSRNSSFPPTPRPIPLRSRPSLHAVDAEGSCLATETCPSSSAEAQTLHTHTHINTHIHTCTHKYTCTHIPHFGH